MKNKAVIDAKKAARKEQEMILNNACVLITSSVVFLDYEYIYLRWKTSLFWQGSESVD